MEEKLPMVYGFHTFLLLHRTLPEELQPYKGGSWITGLLLIVIAWPFFDSFNFYISLGVMLIILGCVDYIFWRMYIRDAHKRFSSTKKWELPHCPNCYREYSHQVENCHYCNIQLVQPSQEE